MRYGLISPLLGLKLDVPGIMLAEAFTPDNNNVRLVDGEIRRAKGPAAEIYDAGGRTMAVPRRIFDIASLSAKTFSVAGDQTSYFSQGDTIRINGSSDNDGLFTVTGAVYDSTNTNISVEEDIYTVNADGQVWQGRARVLHMHQLVTAAAGLEYFFVFTAHHILRWLVASRTFIVEWEVAASEGCQGWSTANFNDHVFATNNSDAPLVWLSSAPGSHFQELTAAAGYVDKARFVTEFENTLVFGCITEGAVVYAQRARWCDWGDHAAWASGDAGYADTAGNDGISGGFAASKGTLYCLKERSIVALWLVVSDDVFNMAVVSTTIGCRAPNSVVVDGQGAVLFYGTDRALRDLQTGVISEAVQRILREVPPDMLNDMRGAYIEELDEVWWALPYGSGSGENNRVLKYRKGTWNNSNFEVGAFGRFNRQAAMVWEDLPYASWEDWAWDTWESVEGAKGYPVDLAADYNGHVRALNASHTLDGEYFASHFVLESDLTEKEQLTRNKRLYHLQTYWRPWPVVIQAVIELKRDGEAEWQPVATIDISGRGEYAVVDTPCDFRGKHFAIRISCERPFGFVGLVADFTPAGMR